MKFRKSAAETLRDNLAAHELYSQLSGKPIPDHIPRPAPKQERKPHGFDGKPLERDVKKAIVKELRKHAAVTSVLVNVSGMAESANGRMYQVGIRGKLDLSIKLRCGRWGELEVKRPGFSPKPHQYERMKTVRAQGGFADWACSVEQAVLIIEGWHYLK